MKILAIDTTFAACSVAVRDGDALLAHRLERMERGHAEALAPMVSQVMEQSRLSYDEIERLGVTTGPGTFTGQRVGLAFMRGLRVALKRPLIGVTSLRAMGEQARALMNVEIAAAIQDARREEVYFEIVASVTVGPMLVPLREAIAELAKVGMGVKIALAGTAAPRAMEIALERGLSVTLSDITAPDADWVARLCEQARESEEVPKALYLREPDAKRPA